MKEKSNGQFISGLTALVLLCVFGVGILSVLLSGAGVYRRLGERDRMAYDSRTCLQYVATKVRQAPAPDSVALSEFGESDCLRLSQWVDGTEYWTRVYCYEGWMMELFTVAGEGFAPEDGEKILQVDSFSLSRDGTLLSVEIVDSRGDADSILLSLRGGEGAGA